MMTLKYHLYNLAAAPYVMLPRDDGKYEDPKIDWKPSDDLQATSRKAAFVLLLLWVVWILAQFALPKKNHSMRSGQVGAGRFIAVAIAIFLLMDLSLVPSLINWGLKVIMDLVNVFR